MKARLTRLAVLTILAVLASMWFVQVAIAGGSQPAPLTIQTVTSQYKYTPGQVVVVRATAQTGLDRLTSAVISTAKVTIKNPSGTVVVNGATMSKDAATGFCFYSYTSASNAPKGIWTATVTITSTKYGTGSAAGTFKIQYPVPSHASYFANYAGTATCITSACHAKQATDMFSSVHYQWQGDTKYAIELAGTKTSKLGGINSFCIWPDGNWLTIMNKLDGTQGPTGGCGWCHAGLGLKPSATSSTTQLNNIDCLICHSSSYKRIVVPDGAGGFKMVPDPAIDIQAAAKDLTRPTRAICMRCHAGAGGGDNYKRGDLESTLKACSKSYDVHMGTDGPNFACQDCHRTDSHRMAGRGSDMRAIDSTFLMSCESCHTQLPHRSYNTNYADLDRHTDRLQCTVCHVPTYAKTIPTDMHRDWSRLEVDTAKQLYDPEMVKATNQKPTYEWFDGYSHFYKFKAPVSLVNGVQKMSWPNGQFVDPAGRLSKLWPFKIHTALQPMEATSRILLPVKTKTAFETGNIALAISEGAAAAGIPYASHTFQATNQYMNIVHGVGPKSSALSCSNQPCHSQLGGTGTRIDYAALGYTRRGDTNKECDVCHPYRTFPGFSVMHAKHRDIRNCDACHGVGFPLKEPKTTLCDNCHRLRVFDNPEHIHQTHVQAKGFNCANCHTYTGDAKVGGHWEEHDLLQ